MSTVSELTICGCWMEELSRDSLTISTFSPRSPSWGTTLMATMPPRHQPWYTFPKDLHMSNPEPTCHRSSLAEVTPENSISLTWRKD